MGFGDVGNLLAMEPAGKRLCGVTTNAVRKIAVEGNIAAGKSTFLKLLQESNARYHAVSEPLTKWCKIEADSDAEVTSSRKHHSNLLDMFYKDQHRWAYTFQTYACVSRLRSQLMPVPAAPQGGLVQFYERSVYSDRYIFAYNCYKNGKMSDTEWHLYCDWHTFLTDTLPVTFDGIIYLRTKPRVCFERLQKRNRQEEKTVKQDYLEALHERHEEWLTNKSIKMSPQIEGIPILTINSDSEFETDKKRTEEMMTEVDTFVRNVYKEDTDKKQVSYS